MKPPIITRKNGIAAVAALMLATAAFPQKTPAAPLPPESPAILAAAPLPPGISPTSPLAQVARLTQAGVDENILLAFITNSSRLFNLDAERLIYLSNLGTPSGVVTAMLQRDQVLQAAFAATQNAQETKAEPAVSTPDSAPTETAEAVTPPAPITPSYWNDTLTPYGSWVVVAGYGRCWRPTVCFYDSGWQPYCDRGHWVSTDCGWYWSSEYAWGATFHYGRWFRDPGFGWCWYPDTVWSPSWVTWRYSDHYCGWAPLPPMTSCQGGVGFAYHGGGVSVSFGFGLGANCYTFVPTDYFCNPHPRQVCAHPAQATQIYNNTTVINNIKIRGEGHNQVVVNNGIPSQNVPPQHAVRARSAPASRVDTAVATPSPSTPLAVTHRHAPQLSIPAKTDAPHPAQLETAAQSPFTGKAVNSISRTQRTHERQVQTSPLPERNISRLTERVPLAAAANRSMNTGFIPAHTAPAHEKSNPQSISPAGGQTPALSQGSTRYPAGRQTPTAQNRSGMPAATRLAPQMGETTLAIAMPQTGGGQDWNPRRRSH